jgi:hypothetical protein
VAYADDVMRSELFRGVDHDERLPGTADSWDLALLGKEFTDRVSHECRAHQRPSRS